MSSNTQTVFATGANKKMYISYDGGTTWSEYNPTSVTDFGWNTGILSQDGLHLYAGEWTGRLYKGTLPAPASTSSGSSAPSITTPGCNDTAPQGTIDMFQINRNGASALLYFTPIRNIRKYHVIYGLTEGDDRYGELGQETENDTGVQSITIQNLNLQSSYWFKVVPVNGCATGIWSNWLNAGKGKKSYFRY